MKKWKQLVVFVMILTMVMGMTSFAATGDAGSTSARTTSGSNSGSDMEDTTPSLSNNQLTVVKNPTLPKEGDNVKLQEVLGLDIKESKVVLNENTTEGKALNTVLAALAAEGFGTTGSETDEKDQMILFEVTIEKELAEGAAVKVTLPCAGITIPDGMEVTKDNFRVLHYNNGKWEVLPIGEYNPETHTISAVFTSFSPVLIDFSVNGKAQSGSVPPTSTDPEEIVKPETPTDPGDKEEPNKPGPEDPNKPDPEDPNKPDPADPTITSDNWKLTYSLIPNKYNTFVLSWQAAEAGRYEVWYSANPSDKNSFKRLTTTKKTTYKFTKAVLDVRYGFKIRVKGSDKFSETLYITNKMDGRVTAPTVSVTSKSYNSLQIKWDKIPGVKRYAIYRNGVKYTEKSGTKMTDKGLETGKEYTYTVQPISMKGAKGTFDGPMSASATNAPKMKGVTSFNVKAVDSATMRISWGKVKGANYYTVCEVVTVDGKEVLEPVAENVTATRCIVPNLAAGSEHTYRVIAHDNYGHSAFSKAKTARTKIVK